jgi:DNA helicase-2/ATP-dependent DNA helicase PcrA
VPSSSKQSSTWTQDCCRRLERRLFLEVRASTITVTTPNGEVNDLLGVPPHCFRHPDHCFGWDRVTFRRWAHGAAHRHTGYPATTLPDSPRLGGASHVASFAADGSCATGGVEGLDPMGMSADEKMERVNLDACLSSIAENLTDIGVRLEAYARDIQDTKSHMWEARRDMDHIDKVAIRQSIEQKMRSGEILKAQQQKLRKLARSPYFGRIDFAREGTLVEAAEAIYLGVHDFRDDISGRTLVYDWRAPVSSMFYDFEPGPAHYEAPAGEITGQLTRKRQFRIRDGQMQFMIESDVNIVDDVLQQELSQSSDEGMKNIVATIQRDQNAIIRDADAHTLIIQGVAGSGKTSIALHRIAFLLYRFKDTLTADDILIVSPNRVFADYIGNVLPELGEQQVNEVGMETLADELLEHKFRYQSFFEQTTLLLEKEDEELKQRVTAKASLDMLGYIDTYVDHIEESSFAATDWRLGRGRIVPAWFLDETWHKHRRKPPTERIAEVLSAAEHKIGLHYNYDLRTEERRALREAIKGMAKKTTLRAAYVGLFNWMDRPDLIRPAGGRLEYADVFPLIYLKMRLEGVMNPRPEVKHLLIDEMQDYTPVQYAVLSRLFKCRKTILGDAAQAVSPYSASTAEEIQRILRPAVQVKLTRSYRSSWEIMQFALGIAPNAELVAMERHGQPPEVNLVRGRAELLGRLQGELDDFRASEHRSLAIITRTQKEAAKLHRELQQQGVDAVLLDVSSTSFLKGIVLCSAHLAKGLEFDRVIVPDASAANYSSDIDRSLLYIACTRAMHRLTVLSPGPPSDLLPGAAVAA